MAPVSHAPRLRRVLCAALLGLSFVVLIRAGSPSAAAAQGPEPVLVERDLDDPGRLSHWAFVVRPGYVRRSPSARSEPVGRLRTTTEDGTDELVPLLGALEDETNTTWVRVRFRHRPNGVTGWVPRDRLGRVRRIATWLRIDLARRRLVLVRDGQVVLRVPVGIGQRRWPTPRGEFYARNRLWGFAPGSIYGPVAFGTNATSDVLTDWPGGGVIGLHGTDQPELIPGRISHGCIRLRNPDARLLARSMRLGTPISIR